MEINTGYTKGGWKWQGEDYRRGWGWQILVGSDGEGIIVGQGENNKPSEYLKAFMPVSSEYCITGSLAADKPHVNAVHVREQDACLIAAAPDMYEALKEAENFFLVAKAYIPSHGNTLKIVQRALAKALGGK